jgi:hypothetical protein
MLNNLQIITEKCGVLFKTLLWLKIANKKICLEDYITGLMVL